MSGFVRTIQKRIMKNKRGYTRQTSEVRTDTNGKPFIYRFPKGTGPVVNGLGVSTGSTRYPTLLKA